MSLGFASMSRQLFVIFLVVSLLGLWRSQDLLVEAQGSQEERSFQDECQGCVVSNGVGFNVFPDDCTCYYMCTFVSNVKLGNRFVAHKKCCPCGTSFSLKHATCVDYRDKSSTCYDLDRNFTNPCLDAETNDLVSRSNPFEVSTEYCKGFIQCENIGGRMVPNPMCCEMNTCFNGSECNSQACFDEPVCEGLTAKQREDSCVCEQTEAPQTVCPYMAVPGHPNQYMGVGMMYIYTCGPGTCFDEDTCGCVLIAANNTNNCQALLTADFENGMSELTNGNGMTLYSEATDVFFITEGAFFNESDSIINAVSTAGAYLGDTFILNIVFTPTESDNSSVDSTQCLVGNCFEAANPGIDGFSDTISVVLNRAGSSNGSDADVSDITISIAYQDKYLMSDPDSMEITTLNVEGPFEIEEEHELWVIFCGDMHEVFATVFTDGSMIASDDEDVFNVQQVIMQQSGFVFGNCPAGTTYEGIISEVTIYNCKPLDNDEFLEVADALEIDL